MNKNKIDEEIGFGEKTIELLEIITKSVNHEEGKVTILFSILAQMHILGLKEGGQLPKFKSKHGQKTINQGYINNSVYFLNGILKAVSDGVMSYEDGYKAYELFNETFSFHRLAEFEKDLKERAERGENETKES